MSDKIVGGIGKTGVEGFELAEQGTTDPKRHEELDRVARLLRQICAAIYADSAQVFSSLDEAHRAEIRRIEREAKEAQDADQVYDNSVLPDPQSLFSRVLWDIWKERGDIFEQTFGLVAGMCVQERHSWFQIKGDMGILCDPRALWIVDPYPRGLTNREQVADIVIVVPHSPFHLAYRGRVIGGVR